MQEQLDFDDVFGLWEPHWWQKPWVLLLVIVSLGIAFFLVVYCMKWYNSRTVSVDPRERALKRLAVINPVKEFQTQDEYKNFYVQVLAVLKEYFDARYGLACSSKTDRELLLYAQSHYKLSHYQDVLQLLVEHGFSVKFARDSATYKRIRDDYESLIIAISAQSRT